MSIFIRRDVIECPKKLMRTVIRKEQRMNDQTDFKELSNSNGVRMYYLKNKHKPELTPIMIDYHEDVIWVIVYDTTGTTENDIYYFETFDDAVSRGYEMLQ